MRVQWFCGGERISHCCVKVSDGGMTTVSCEVSHLRGEVERLQNALIEALDKVVPPLEAICIAHNPSSCHTVSNHPYVCHACAGTGTRPCSGFMSWFSRSQLGTSIGHAVR